MVYCSVPPLRSILDPPPPVQRGGVRMALHQQWRHAGDCHYFPPLSASENTRTNSVRRDFHETGWLPESIYFCLPPPEPWVLVPVVLAASWRSRGGRCVPWYVSISSQLRVNLIYGPTFTDIACEMRPGGPCSVWLCDPAPLPPF